MTFQQLTYVVEISKCGSINKAAHKLFLSQSGISTAVRELEEELGIRFFTRSNRGVEFTPDGKEFLSYAVSLLEQKQRIESLYGESSKATAPTRFSVSTQRYPFTEDAFLRMLQSTQENRYCFSIREAGMDAVIDDVYDHRADLGVIFLTELTEKSSGGCWTPGNWNFTRLPPSLPASMSVKGIPLPTATVSARKTFPATPTCLLSTARASERISLRNIRSCPSRNRPSRSASITAPP